MSFPIFSAGTSRGGTTFFARMLSMHSQMGVISDPFLPLFKSFRNCVYREAGLKDFDFNRPFDDYYFSDERLKLKEILETSTLELAFPQDETDLLRNQLRNRMSLAAKECVPHVGLIGGKTYKDWFASGLEIPKAALNAQNKSWIGFNDNWVVEFFPVLLRAFPEARFLVIVRDPRACIASALRQKDLSRVAFMYSFARSWRKHAAMAWSFSQSEVFKERLMVLRYEDVAIEPERTALRLCQFFGLDYEPAMLDTARYRPIAGEHWTNYSNFDVPAQGIYKQAVSNWHDTLDEPVREMIEFVCGPEMILHGYQPIGPFWDQLSEPAFNFIVHDDREAQGWRCPYESLDRELGYELLRHYALKSNTGLNCNMQQRLFLFPELYRKLKPLRFALSHG